VICTFLGGRDDFFVSIAQRQEVRDAARPHPEVRRQVDSACGFAAGTSECPGHPQSMPIVDSVVREPRMKRSTERPLSPRLGRQRAVR
jgi:hypothetical protein